MNVCEISVSVDLLVKPYCVLSLYCNYVAGLQVSTDTGAVTAALTALPSLIQPVEGLQAG
jgi:hypothetical protein